MIPESPPSQWGPRMLSVLRIVAALLYIEHGTQKLFAFPPGPHTPLHLLTQNGAAGVLETFGGLAILVGLFTRPVAFLLAGEMAVAYFQVHLPRSVFPIVNRGDTAVLFCFLYLYLMVAGGGVWSLDHAIAMRKRAARTPDEFGVRDSAPGDLADDLAGDDSAVGTLADAG